MHFMRETRTEIEACKQLKAHKTKELVEIFDKKMKSIVRLAALQNIVFSVVKAYCILYSKRILYSL